MWQRLGSFQLSKTAALALVVSLALMPWFQGGKDPVGWMVLLGVALLGGFILWRSDTKITAGRLGLAWVLYSAWTALSLIWSVNRYQTFTTLLLYLLISIIFILAAAVSSSHSGSKLLEAAYIVFGSIAAAIGLIFYVINSYSRATSTFYLPNPFAGFLLPLVIIGLWRYLKGRRWFDGLLVVVSLGTLTLTDSRGAILSLVAVLVIGSWLSPKLIKQWRQLATVLVGAVLLVLLSSLLRSHYTHNFSLQGARFRDIASTDSTSTSDRIYYLKSAIAIWKDHPLGGSGAGTFASLHPKYQYRVISAGSSVHNYYAQTLSELGIIGFGLLIYVLIQLVLGVVRGLRADPDKLPLALALLALLLHAAVDIDASYPVLWTLVAVLAGLCYQPKGERGFKLLSAQTMAFATSIVLALPVIWLFQNQVKAQNGFNLQQAGDYSRAVSYYEAAHLHPPYDPDWLNAEGINHFLLATISTDKAANLNQALALAKEGSHLDPDDGQHDLLLGRVLVQQNKLNDAKAAFIRAIAKDPYDHPDYYNDLAGVYLRQNNLVAASTTIKRVISLYPPSVIANRNYDATLPPALSNCYVTSAEVAASRGELTLARSDLDQALKLDQTNLAARLLLAQIGTK